MNRKRITGKFIDSLPAGREMDRLVANVIGDENPPLDYSRFDRDAWRALEIVAKQRKMHACVRTPFDTRQRDPRGDDDSRPSPEVERANALYWAGFTVMGATGWNGRDDWRSSADTMPLAVCRAILRVAHCKPQL